MTAIVPEALHQFPTAFTRAREGDHDAFAELIEQHEAMVYSLAWNFFGDRSRAEEVAQDVFLQLYRHLDNLESDAHVLFWLRQVTTRRCIDLTRRSKLKAVSLDDAGDLPAAHKPADPLLDRRLKRLVQELPDAQRAIVTLRYQEDLDPSEICRIVGMPVNTVKSHLHRALQSLRRKLEKHP
ncbi:MAG TPA: sigma-70 family RNA polymerase sigma factor [Thermoanaerobaculia bacterium]|nr:sigma-70 family RNA polymerase sigma factor [Thermoanaerobaculia bacterium]